ncbi:MAG: thioredoxin [Clostridia bacterium]|nr:thioredoxin [Clostridia bacterium]
MAEITLTKDNFETEVLKSEVPVLIDFWAAWCGPCKMIAPTVEEIASEYDGKIKVGKVNVDDEPELAMAFKVSSIPLIVVVNKGEVVSQLVGYRAKEDLVEMFENLI